MSQKIKVDIGFDISSSIIGICVLEHQTGKMLKLANIVLTSSKLEDLFDKIGAFNKVWQPDPSWDIRNIYIEDIAKKFSSGASSANTIVILAKMNALVCHSIYVKTGLKPTYVNVRSVRAKVGIKVDSKDKTKTTKQKVFEAVKSLNPSFPWETHISKTGKHKGETVYDKCNEDMADSWITCRGGQLTTSGK